MSTDHQETGVERDPAEYRAEAIEANRPAFEFWKTVCSLIEDVIAVGRPHTSSYDLAIDCLFLQAYKSFCAVYLMGVRGHEEDAATLLRRLLEIAAQVEYLAQPTEAVAREERARLYLDHEPDDGGYWWHGNIFELFDRIGAAATYRNDYRLLAQISHAAARRVLPRLRDGVVQIRSTEALTPFLMFACRYVLAAARLWNETFHLTEAEGLQKLILSNLEYRPDANAPEAPRGL